MVIAVPTGIKIFSWLLYSFSKSNLASKVNFNLLGLSGLANFFSTHNFIQNNSNCTSLVVFGSNLQSNVDYGRFSPSLANVIVLTEYLYGVVIGLLLSDAWLMRNNSNSNSRLAIKQSLNNFGYLWFVFNLLAPYCPSYPSLRKANLKGVIFYAVQLTTRSLPCFTQLFNLFYKNGVKIVPCDIYNLITIQGLAHWIMGDGSYVKGGGLYLNTQSFSIVDCVKLINVLMIKFDCKCTLHLQRNLPIIYISKKTMFKLYPQLLPHMAPSMMYKLLGKN